MQPEHALELSRINRNQLSPLRNIPIRTTASYKSSSARNYKRISNCLFWVRVLTCTAPTGAPLLHCRDLGRIVDSSECGERIWRPTRGRTTTVMLLVGGWTLTNVKSQDGQDIHCKNKQLMIGPRIEELNLDTDCFHRKQADLHTWRKSTNFEERFGDRTKRFFIWS